MWMLMFYLHVFRRPSLALPWLTAFFYLNSDLYSATEIKTFLVYFGHSFRRNNQKEVFGQQSIT